MSIHFEFATLLNRIFSLCTIFASLHERGLLYMNVLHQHANSTPPFEKSGYGPEQASCLIAKQAVEFPHVLASRQ